MAYKETKSTMREFAANDQADYYSGITSIMVNGKNAYELKGKFLDDLQKNAFSGTIGHERNLFDYETPLCEKFKEFNYLLTIDPDLLTKDIEGFKTYDEYKDDWIYEWNENVPWWPTCSWKEDGYCNGGNLPGAYIVGNTLRYQDLERYNALKDSELKDEALRNKAIMEGLINKDNKSSNNSWRRWDRYEIVDHDQEEREYENGHEDKERYELFDDHELPVWNIRRFEMIKYSFGDDEEEKTDEEFTESENNKERADIQATNILSQGLPRHIFNTLNQTETNSKDISTVSYVDLYTHLKSYEQHALKTFSKMKQTSGNTDPLAYIAKATQSTSSPSQYVPPPPQYAPAPQQAPQSTNDAMLLRTSTNPMTQATIQDGQITIESVQRRAPGNKGKHVATGFQGKVVTCYNCRGQGHVEKECYEKK
ncbi:hypothetical protein Tco_1569233, partial [Tanacetum coccineum]